MNIIGELAALATSFFFAMTAIIFTLTGRMVGSQVTSRMGLVFALVYLVILNIVLFREPLTIETARRVGSLGKVVTIDIEPKMIERVQQRAQAEGVTNLEAKIADVYRLPFEDGMFDAIYMITVIGEIPEPGRAMREFYRVLTIRYIGVQ